MTPLSILLAAAVLFAGGIVKGAIGFALPSVTVPFLSLLLSPKEAVVMMSVPILLTNLFNVRLGWREWRRLGEAIPYFATGLLAIPAGVRFLSRADPEIVRLLIGLAVWAYLSVHRFLPPMEGLRPHARAGVGAGLGAVAGFLMGAASLPGPVNVIYFSMFAWPKEAFIFVMNAYNTLSATGLVSTLALRGDYAAPALLRIGAALVPVCAGFWAGLRLRARLRPEVFQRIVRIVLFFVAGGLVVRSAWRIFL